MKEIKKGIVEERNCTTEQVINPLIKEWSREIS